MSTGSRSAIVSTYMLLLAWALVPVAQAGDANQLSLRDCLDMAVHRNNDVKAAQASVHKAEAVLTQARSGHYPQISLGARYMKLNESFRLEDFTLTATLPAGMGGGQADFQIEEFELSDDRMLIGEAMVEMPIFTWNKISNYGRMAKRGIEVEEIKLKALHDRLRFDVVSAYKTALLAKEARRTLLEVIDEMELFSKTANQDFEDGASNAPQKDVLQVQYDLNDMKTWLPELDKWETLSIEALKIAIGEDRESAVAVMGDTLEYPQVRFDLDELLGQALENRPELQMLGKAREVSVLQKKVAQVSNLPMFGVFGKYTHTADDFDPNQENTWVVGVGATMALFDGMKSVGMYREADAGGVVLKHQLAQAKRGISLQVQEALTEVDEYYQQLKIREDSRAKAVEQVNVVRQGYQFGITTVKDVNDAQVQKRWADAHYLFKKLEYVTAIAKLNRMVGVDVHSFD